MTSYILRDELIQKINTFNQIFELDFMNSAENEKNWKSYLDPITMHLYGCSYLSFVKDTSLDINVPPGALEKYFNVFFVIINDFKSITLLKVPNEIYCAAEEVKKTFDDFIKLNNISVSMVNDAERENCPKIYQLYPTL